MQMLEDSDLISQSGAEDDDDNDDDDEEEQGQEDEQEETSDETGGGEGQPAAEDRAHEITEDQQKLSTQQRMGRSNDAGNRAPRGRLLAETSTSVAAESDGGQRAGSSPGSGCLGANAPSQVRAGAVGLFDSSDDD